MPNPLIGIGTVANDGTGDPLRTAFQKVNRLPNPNQIINAGSGDYTGTNEQKIQAAINDAVSKSILTDPRQCYQVFIPATMLPYNPVGITFNTAIRMTRESSAPNWFDVVAYGATAGGNVDDSVAILTAAAAANARQGGGTVYFCDFSFNSFLLTAPLTFNNYTDVSFIGQGGPNQSKILMGAVDAHCLNFTGVCSRITIRDLWLGTTSAKASGAGLQIIGTAGVHSDRFVVEHVTIQNLPSPLRLQYLDNSVFRDIQYYQSLVGATTGAVFSMNTTISTQFYGCFDIVTAGTLPAEVWLVDYDCDTVAQFGCQALFAGTFGFNWAKSAGTTGPRLCRATNCWSESNGSGGYSISAARDVRLLGCHAAVNTGSGYTISGGDSISITDSLALQNQQYGILVSGGTGVKVLGNTCSNNSQQTNNTYDGMRIAAGLIGVRVIGNHSGDFILSLANKQRYGLSLGGGGSDVLHVWANILSGNQTGTIENFSQGTSNSIQDSNVVRVLPVRAVALTDAATIAVDATLGSYFYVTLTASGHSMGAPSGGVTGQQLTFTILQDGTGGRTLLWNAAYALLWSDTGNTLNKRSSITFINRGDGVWTQATAQTPYV